jgi:hypothetical protein
MRATVAVTRPGGGDHRRSRLGGIRRVVKERNGSTSGPGRGSARWLQLVGVAVVYHNATLNQLYHENTKVRKAEKLHRHGSRSRFFVFSDFRVFVIEKRGGQTVMQPFGIARVVLSICFCIAL